MIAQAHLPDSERLRMLGLMGIDVYVPRITPLARTVEVSPLRAPDAGVVAAPSIAAPRVFIAGVGVGAGEHTPLLDAVLRSVRLRRQDWALAGESTSMVPEWRFGQSEEAVVRAPALALPSLFELRNSVTARRSAWHVLRKWLRNL